MAIDARVVGLRGHSRRSEVTLTLEPRQPGGCTGQPTLTITNAPLDWHQSPLPRLIGCEIWGGSSQIMLGDRELAKRDSYLALLLVDNWQEVILNHLGIG